MKRPYFFIIFLIVFGVYIYTMSPGLTSDDSGELAGVCATLGIAHPSGYPLYSILGKIFDTIFPFANAVYRANLMAAFFGAAAAAVVFLIINIWSAPAAAAASLILAFAVQFWNMGIVTEVYMLNAFFAALIIYLMVSKEAPGEAPGHFFWKRLLLISFLSGLALGNHFTIALIFPAVLVWALFNFGGIKNRSYILLITAGFFVLGLLIYVFIPIRALQNPIYSWEDPKTLDRFIYLVSRARYSGLLAQGNPLPVTPGMIYDNLVFFLEIMLSTFSKTGTVLVLLAVIFAFIGKFKESAILFTAFFVAGPGFFIVARVPLGTQMKDLLERFVYLSFIPLSLLFGLGLSLIPFRKNIQYLALALPAFMLVSNFNGQLRRNDFVYYDYAKNILRTPARGALIFSDRADEMEFCCSHLIWIQKRRGDITFIDCNAGASKSIYGDDYYGIWGKPRLQRRLKVETEWIKRAFGESRSVFYSTFEPEMIPIPRIKYGLLCEVPKTGALRQPKFFNWAEVISLRAPLKQDIRSNFLYEGNFYLLGKFFLEAGFPEEAKKQYMAPAMIYNRPGMLLEIPWWYFSKGQYQKAQKEYLELLKIKEDWPEAYVNLGVVYEKLSEFTLAQGAYNRAIELKPEYVQAYYNRGVLYWKTGDWKKVAENFKKVVELQPQNVEARKYLSIALDRLK